ncbi:hypothetical protein RLEG12_04170 (plasmid) [Rhizobium leguminosarum bv. trifolii CB782]|nr:hypothetical protein RLEG12_04170 [Rhizobium leguminosarum bv. trifolii CB782]
MLEEAAGLSWPGDGKRKETKCHNEQAAPIFPFMEDAFRIGSATG